MASASIRGLFYRRVSLPFKAQRRSTGISPRSSGRTGSYSRLSRAPRLHLFSYLLAGYVVGFSSAVLGGYALYHFSGLRRAVNTFAPAMRFLTETEDTLRTETAPRIALNYLRQAAKVYVAYIPGAGFLVDQTFNQIDKVVDQHLDQANRFIQYAYEDIKRVVVHGQNKRESHSVWEILAISRRLLEDLSALGVNASMPIVDQLGLREKFEAVGSTAGSLVETVKQKSPGWKASVEQGASKIQGLLKQPFSNQPGSSTGSEGEVEKRRDDKS